MNFPRKRQEQRTLKSGKQGTEKGTRWKRLDLLSKKVYCANYKELQKETQAVRAADNNLTPLKVFENSIIIEVIRPVLNFFFFYDKISRVQKKTFFFINIALKSI